MFNFVHLRVSQYMSAPPITVSPDAPLTRVEELLEAHGFNGCPVVDGDGRLIGMVTGFDLIKACEIGPGAMLPRYEEIMRRPVAEVMSPVPQTVGPDLPLTRLLQLMIDCQRTGFPVTESDRLLGMITRRDVTRALRECSAQAPGDASEGVAS